MTILLKSLGTYRVDGVAGQDLRQLTARTSAVVASRAARTRLGESTKIIQSIQARLEQDETHTAKNNKLDLLALIIEYASLLIEFTYRFNISGPTLLRMELWRCLLRVKPVGPTGKPRPNEPEEPEERVMYPY